jgi:tetratricopeptide (TPR) repeat protein/predicted Ser/Thr protein kinase
VERWRALTPGGRSELARRVARDDADLLAELTTLFATPDAAPALSPDSVLPSGGALAGDLWERLAAELAQIESDAQALAAGSRIGRYVVIERLGSGGMGAVYAAYDPELDRQVAVKVLRHDLFGGRGAPHEWLRREAQALARLSHPNVVTIHDVGSDEGRLFLAMERVEGADLRSWLAARPRSRREILALFRAIGEGLAAAHAAGLVHRDFKPQNVIVGGDGRPRILDFGLAQAADAPTGPAAHEPEASAPDTSPARSRRVPAPEGRTPRLVGTPAYMAPEQLVGGPVDARSDQYAFCLALWEALCGERPFATHSLTRLAESRAAGTPSAPAPGVELPSHLRKLLQRGLAPSPDDRFPSMDALVAELRETATARRWAAAAALVALAAILAWTLRERVPACRGADELLSSVWSASRRSSMAAAFAASGRPRAADAAQRVAHALDRWAASWAEMRTDACLATRVRGEQSEALLDLRVACLDRRRDEARAFVDLLVVADETTVAEAPRAVLGVAPIAVCADPRLLSAPAPPPTDADDGALLAELQDELAEAKALRDLGRPAEAAQAARALVGRLEALGAPLTAGVAAARWAAPLEAESHYLLADLEDLRGDFDTAESHLFAAWAAAVRGGHEEYVARSLNLLLWLDGNDRADLASGRAWAELAEATLDRMDAGPWLRAEYHNNLGAAFQTAGLAEESLQQHELALALRQQLYGPDSYEVAKSLNNLGSAYFTAARFREAESYYQRALEIVQAALGAHPATAMAWSNVGSSLIELGDAEAAREAHRRSLDIRRSLFGEESLWAAISIGNLGFADLVDRPADAPAHFEAMRRALESALPADHPYQAYPLSGLGRARLALGEPAAAVPLLERALALWESTGAASAHDLATDRFALARALWESGRDRRRALDLARLARDGLAALAVESLPLRDQVAEWLSANAAAPAG